MKSHSLSSYDENFWPPWADVLLTILLVLLLYIFVQYVTYSGINELVKVKPAQERLEQLILEEFARDYKDAIRVRRDGNFQIITFSDKILFDLARAEIKEQGKEVLSRLGRLLNLEKDLYERIQVEGHTCDLRPNPMGPFRSNWELSSARATSVVRFLQESSEITPGKLSANGYSEFQPVAPNMDERSRGLNRRIEIVLVYTTQGGRQRLQVMNQAPETVR
jgi:flagellar motor protein MotB